MPNMPLRFFDLHHHLVPPAYVHELEERGINRVGGVVFPKWSPELSLEVMDRVNIERAVLSLSAPGVFFGDAALAVHLAHLVNDEARHIIDKFPDRFGAFATLPLPDVPASLVELTRALDDLKLNGVSLLTNYAGIYLGDPRFDALMAELHQRAATVFIHPTSPPNAAAIELPYPIAMIEYPFETTRAVTHLVFSGVFKKYPNIRFILPHAGGTIPFLADRITFTGMFLTKGPRTAPKGAEFYFRQQYYDTALATSAPVLRALRAFVDPAHIVFGSDFPFAPDIIAQQSTERLASSEVFTDAEKAQLSIENAHALFTSSRNSANL